MLKKLIAGAALALAALTAHATCTLTTFRAYPDAGAMPTGIPLPPTGCVDALNLAANTAKADTPLTGANRVIFGTNCASYYVKTDGTTAAVVAGDITDGSAPMLNPTALQIVGVTSISVISPVACQVTLWYFK